MLTLFTRVTGESPTATKVEDLPGCSFNLTSYEWTGKKIVADECRASISVTVAALNGTPIQAGTGISVGSSRAAVLADQGKDVIDANGDGVADQLELDSREEPGTKSLSRSGSPGIS